MIPNGMSFLYLVLAFLAPVRVGGTHVHMVYSSGREGRKRAAKGEGFPVLRLFAAVNFSIHVRLVV